MVAASDGVGDYFDVHKVITLARSSAWSARLAEFSPSFNPKSHILPTRSISRTNKRIDLICRCICAQGYRINAGQQSRYLSFHSSPLESSRHGHGWTEDSILQHEHLQHAVGMSRMAIIVNSLRENIPRASQPRGASPWRPEKLLLKLVISG